MSKPCTFAHTRAVHRRRSVEIFTEVFTLHMVRATRSARMLRRRETEEKKMINNFEFMLLLLMPSGRHENSLNCFSAYTSRDVKCNIKRKPIGLTLLFIDIQCYY